MIVTVKWWRDGFQHPISMEYLIRDIEDFARRSLIYFRDLMQWALKMHASREMALLGVR